MSIETLSDITKIVVETDEKDPKTIAVITADDIDSAEGFRVRITPKYDQLGDEINAPLHDILRGRWNQVRRILVTN